MSKSPDPFGPLELLVLQPTPFCNINCSYCYLPNRDSRRQMTPGILETAYNWVFETGLVRDPFTVLWHAGEPLVLPIEFYRDAIKRLEQKNHENIPVCHSFQTNGTLLNSAWCDFLEEHKVHLGVSVDGPAFLHDRNRRTRSGQATLDRTIAGIELLHQRGIPFDVLTVVTAETLDYPDELFDFFRALNIHKIGFNCEEIEGPHTTTSLNQVGVAEKFRSFFRRFLELGESIEPRLEIREVESTVEAVYGEHFAPGSRTQVNNPWATINIDCDGNFSTYSPELLGIQSERYGSFSLGNVAHDSFRDVIRSHRFRTMEADIARGIDRCVQSCDYFRFCGGGPPGNKYFEHGTFDCTETLSCQLQLQACVDVTLDYLERDF